MPGRAYTMKEMRGIVEYITAHSLYGEVKGRKMWMDFSSTGLTSRTWQSLKETFLKRVLPDIHNPYYKLSMDQIRSFRTGVDVAKNAAKLELRTASTSSNNVANEEPRPSTSKTNDSNESTGEDGKAVKVLSNRASLDTVVLGTEECYETAEDLIRELDSDINASDNVEELQPRRSLRDCITYSDPLTPLLQDIIHDFDSEDSGGDLPLEIVLDNQLNKDNSYSAPNGSITKNAEQVQDIFSEIQENGNEVLTNSQGTDIPKKKSLKLKKKVVKKKKVSKRETKKSFGKASEEANRATHEERSKTSVNKAKPQKERASQSSGEIPENQNSIETINTLTVNNDTNNKEGGETAINDAKLQKKRATRSSGEIPEKQNSIENINKLTLSNDTNNKEGGETSINDAEPQQKRARSSCEIPEKQNSIENINELILSNDTNKVIQNGVPENPSQNATNSITDSLLPNNQEALEKKQNSQSDTSISPNSLGVRKTSRKRSVSTDLEDNKRKTTKRESDKIINQKSSKECAVEVQVAAVVQPDQDKQVADQQNTCTERHSRKKSLESPKNLQETILAKEKDIESAKLDVSSQENLRETIKEAKETIPSSNPCLQSVSLFEEVLLVAEDNDEVSPSTGKQNSSKQKQTDVCINNNKMERKNTETVVENEAHTPTKKTQKEIIHTNALKLRKIKENGEEKWGVVTEIAPKDVFTKESEILVLRSHSESDSEEKIQQKRTKQTGRSSTSKHQRNQVINKLFGNYSGVGNGKPHRKNKYQNLPTRRQNIQSSDSEYTTESDSEVSSLSPRCRHRRSWKTLKPPSYKIQTHKDMLFVEIGGRAYPLVKNGKPLIYRPNDESEEDEKDAEYWRLNYIELRKKKHSQLLGMMGLETKATEREDINKNSADQRRESPILPSTSFKRTSALRLQQNGIHSSSEASKDDDVVPLEDKPQPIEKPNNVSLPITAEQLTKIPQTTEQVSEEMSNPTNESAPLKIKLTKDNIELILEGGKETVTPFYHDCLMKMFSDKAKPRREQKRPSVQTIVDLDSGITTPDFDDTDEETRKTVYEKERKILEDTKMFDKLEEGTPERKKRSISVEKSPELSSADKHTSLSEPKIIGDSTSLQSETGNANKRQKTSIESENGNDKTPSRSRTPGLREKQKINYYGARKTEDELERKIFGGKKVVEDKLEEGTVERKELDIAVEKTAELKRLSKRRQTFATADEHTSVSEPKKLSRRRQTFVELGDSMPPQSETGNAIEKQNSSTESEVIPDGNDKTPSRSRTPSLRLRQKKKLGARKTEDELERKIFGGKKVVEDKLEEGTVERKELDIAVEKTAELKRLSKRRQTFATADEHTSVSEPKKLSRRRQTFVELGDSMPPQSETGNAIEKQNSSTESEVIPDGNDKTPSRSRTPSLRLRQKKKLDDYITNFVGSKIDEDEDSQILYKFPSPEPDTRVSARPKSRLGSRIVKSSTTGSDNRARSRPKSSLGKNFSNSKYGHKTPTFLYEPKIGLQSNDTLMQSNESSQGYQDSDISLVPINIKRKKKLSLQTTKARKSMTKNHNLVKKQNYFYWDASGESSNSSFHSLPARNIAARNSSQNTEEYRSESYQLLMPPPRNLRRLEIISETSPCPNEMNSAGDLRLSPASQNMNEADQSKTSSINIEMGNSSSVSLPLSPELSIVENINFSKEVVQASADYFPTINELQESAEIIKDCNESYIISKLDISIPLMAQDCNLKTYQKEVADSDRSIENNNFLDSVNTSKGNDSTFNKAVTVSDSLLGKIDTVNIKNHTLSESLDLKLRNLLLESAKKIAKENKTAEESMEHDGKYPIIQTEMQKKAKSKKRCSTPQKRKGAKKTQPLKIDAVIEEERMEFCSSGRKSCPPAISVFCAEEPYESIEDLNTTDKTIPDRKKGKRAKDIIKVKITRPKKPPTKKSNKKNSSKMSLLTDSGINDTASSAVLQSFNGSVDLIHNHSETCLHANECLSNDIEIFNKSNSLISVNSSMQSDKENLSNNIRTTLSPEFFSNDAQDGSDKSYELTASSNGEVPRSPVVFYAASVPSVSSLITEDLSDESPKPRPSAWHLFSEDDTTNTVDPKPAPCMVKPKSYLSNLKQLFPIACAVPDLSTITERTETDANSKSTVYTNMDSTTRNAILKTFEGGESSASPKW